MKPPKLLLAILLALPAAMAGEFKVEKKPFKSTVSLEGVFLPDKAHPLKIDPKAWADFTIKELVAQGANVKLLFAPSTSGSAHGEGPSISNFPRPILASRP